MFVYGTLKRGDRNHYLLANSEFLGEARTRAPVWRLVEICEPGHYPYPAAEEHGNGHIFGEVYRVDAATLAALDALEAEGEDYVRKKIEVAGFEDVRTYIGMMTEHRFEASPRIIRTESGYFWRGDDLACGHDPKSLCL